MHILRLQWASNLNDVVFASSPPRTSATRRVDGAYMCAYTNAKVSHKRVMPLDVIPRASMAGNVFVATDAGAPPFESKLIRVCRQWALQ